MDTPEPPGRLLHRERPRICLPLVRVIRSRGWGGFGTALVVGGTGAILVEMTASVRISRTFWSRREMDEAFCFECAHLCAECGASMRYSVVPGTLLHYCTHKMKLHVVVCRTTVK